MVGSPCRAYFPVIDGKIPVGEMQLTYSHHLQTTRCVFLQQTIMGPSYIFPVPFEVHNPSIE